MYKFAYLLCFGYAIVFMFVHIGKIVVGRLRPNFYSVCNPQPTNITPYGYISSFVCTETNEERIGEMRYLRFSIIFKIHYIAIYDNHIGTPRLSFPSAHSAYAMFLATFICVSHVFIRLNQYICIDKIH